MQVRGKLVDKVKNILYLSPDKIYMRKRKRRSSEDEFCKKKTVISPEGEIFLGPVK